MWLEVHTREGEEGWTRMLKTAGSTDVLNRAINGIDAKLADNKQNDLCSEQINPSEGFPFVFQKRFKFTRLLPRLKVGNAGLAASCFHA